MNTTLNDLIDKLTSGDIPAGAMGGAGILLILLTLRTAKGVMRVILVLVAIALLGGAVWWHFSRHR
jgi:hypothetical protein